MKNSDDHISAWIDNSLDDRAKAEVEARFSIELLEQEKAAAARIGELLRTHSKVPTLEAPDFFNSQIIEQISGETPEPVEPGETGFEWRWWSLRLAWATACVLIAGAILFVAVPGSESSDPILVNVENFTSGYHVSSFTSDADRYAVVWVDGWDYIPGDTLIQ